MFLPPVEVVAQGLVGQEDPRDWHHDVLKENVVEPPAGDTKSNQIDSLVVWLA